MDRSDPVAALRRFNRFYTRRIGVLHERPLDGAFSLAQTRLLWELAHRDGLTAALLARELDLDPGYLSRLLRSLRERGLLRTTRSKADGREALLALTAAGRRAFAPLDQRSQQDMQALLEPLPDAEQHRLVDAAATIENLLGGDRTPASATIELLDHLRPGDLGWLVSRHGVLYAHEYGWDMRFEALVAHIAARFVERYEPSLERAWIAERGATPLGCIFLVQCRDEQTDAPLAGVAQLRLLLVEPSARGSGLGRRLVAECTRFARAAGYRRIRLWTQSILCAARSIYQNEGYRLVATEPHDSFGHQLTGETWELAL
jgi:DNA-binding MarR family transcriptional regulator/GNAT superfamily N-acetyltransferase